MEGAGFKRAAIRGTRGFWILKKIRSEYI